MHIIYLCIINGNDNLHRYYICKLSLPFIICKYIICILYIAQINNISYEGIICTHIYVLCIIYYIYIYINIYIYVYIYKYIIIIYTYYILCYIHIK